MTQPTQTLAATLAANVAAVRRARGLSQRGLARAAGTSQMTVLAIENGTCNVRLSTLTRIAHVLQTDPAALLADKGK